MSDFFSLKMRASRDGRHISGAEKIVPPAAVVKTAATLAERALGHPKGAPDFINLKIERTADPVRLESLPVTTHRVATPEEGRALAAQLLKGVGIANIDAIMARFAETHSLRGAMLLDADTLERLEPDKERGVRATYMDDAESLAKASASGKNHYAEAIVLATKVQHAPGIIAEICVSDDPDYATGYVATRDLGYRRITMLKHKGDPNGGRIFLYRGRREDVARTIDFLEHTPVVVEHVPVLTDEIPERRFELIKAELAEIEANGLTRRLRLVPPEALVLSSNDYLGLAGRSGSTGSRLTTGTHPEHLELERRLATFKGTEAALFFATGYMANVGVITALAKKGDAILSDELNHASIIDGCRLSGADVIVYRHLDMDDLERKLAACREHRRRLVVSDGVFSMDGDLLNLPRFLEICRRHDAFSIVDEAHATGVIGKTGRGLFEHFHCDHPDLTVATLSKSIGSEGGFVCTSQLLVDYLVNRARSFIFSTAPSPETAASALDHLDRLENEPELVEKLRANVSFFLSELYRHGVETASESAIVPIVIGDERRATEVSERLLSRGFVVNAIRYPTVPKGKARLRVALNASLTREELSRAAEAIAECLSVRSA